MKDPRERHIVCKLDRYQLEDRYLRLLEEVNSLKKLSNSQEDKIKRLATKLMRFGANPRACITSIDITDDRDKLSLLEAENSKLKDKVCLLRNQLINHKIFGRSPSRGRKSALGSNSSPVTCRSESSQLRNSFCHCNNILPVNNEQNPQNCSLKLQEVEAEKERMLSRITELEVELASFTSGSRREKVAENIEYIRVWRQMKRQNEKLIAAENANEILSQQVQRLKHLLEESSKNNKQVNEALADERKQVARLDESISKAEDSKIELREKDERIMDLTSEMKILQQHNHELLELSSKFGKIEQENAEFKRKINEQMSEYIILKDALSKEKANAAALQAANDQLLTKLHESQKNIDMLTIQLMEPNEKRKGPLKKTNKQENDEPLSEGKSLCNETLKSSLEVCKTCCSDWKHKKPNRQEQGVQSDKLLLTDEETQTDKFIESAKSKENDVVQKYDKNNKHIQLHKNGNSLSREDMLKLLEQAQINTPLESQNNNRIMHSEASKTGRISRPMTNLETLLFGNSNF